MHASVPNGMGGTSHTQLARIATLLLIARASAAEPVSPPAGEPTTHPVRWTREAGATSCIAEVDLVAGVEQRLGRALTGDRAMARVIEGRVEPTAGGYRARIVVLDERGAALGERELVEDSPDCRKLDDKLTLVIALAIDPDAVTRQRGTLPSRVRASRTIPVVPSAPERWALALGVSGAAALGVLPGLGIGGRLSFTIDPPAVPPFVIAASGWAPDRETLAAGGSRFTRFGLGARMCPRLRAGGRLGAGLCGGVEVERMTATGFGFDTNQRAVDWIVSVAAEAVVTARLGNRWSADLGIGGWVPLIRPRIVYTDGTKTPTVYQPAAVAAVLQLGITVAL